MKLIHHIVERMPETNRPEVLANYNTIEQVRNCTESLGIDGVYYDVYMNRDVLIGKEVILFITGDYIGKDNSFDVGMPLEMFANYKQIEELEKMGCVIGWHTWSHRDLTTLSVNEIRKELTAPQFCRKYLAYPYGNYNDTVVKIAKEMGFEEAWSVTQGKNEPFKRIRTYL